MKIYKSYKMLNEFAEKVSCLASMLRQSFVSGRLAAKMPVMAYTLSEIRAKERSIKHIFVDEKARRCFAHLDNALFDLERSLHSPATDQRAYWVSAYHLGLCANELKGMFNSIKQMDLGNYTAVS